MLRCMRLAIRWSGKRDSNPRPLPWQGNALPAELFPLAKVILEKVPYMVNLSNKKAGKCYDITSSR
jgi:hypothetical protein